MARSFALTDAQKDASDRHAIDGVVYLLSGTLVGRDAVPNATFYWSTREVTALGQTFKPFLGPPQQIQRTIGFEPGAQGIYREVRIPVRNLPFAHSESMVAAVSDDDFRFENATATLRVAYLKPGQDPDTLADSDWTAVLLDGVLGPPDEVTLDGFVLPVYTRGARRNQNLFWPRLPTEDTISGGAIDRKDAGRMPPLCLGAPQDWIRVPTINCGVRGFLVSGYGGGDTVIQFSRINVGPEDLVSGNTPAGDVNQVAAGSYGTGTGRASIMVHYMGPVYEVSGVTFDEAADIFTVTLASGLAADVPRGGFVQQWGPGFNPATGSVLGQNANGASDGRHSWWWVLGNTVHTPEPVDGRIDGLQFGWLFPDGEVRPAESGEWPFDFAFSPDRLDLKDEGGQNIGGLGQPVTEEVIEGAPITLTRGTRLSPKAPVYYDPLAGLPTDVSQQPEFGTTAQERLTSSINRATGGTGAGNEDLRDGSLETGQAFSAGDVKTLTFPDAPAGFDNADTTRSVLHIVGNGNGSAGINFTNSTGSTLFFAMTSAVATTYAVTQSAPRAYNATIRIAAPSSGGGGQVIEVWWEHDAATDIDLTRTQDVKLVSSDVAIGPEMQFAELVMKIGPAASRIHTMAPSGDVILGQSFAFPTLVSSEKFLDVTAQVPYPTNVMIGLHTLLGSVEGTVNAIDRGSYEAAHQRFVDKNIRINLVWDDESRPSSWTELERRMGEQTRSFMYYGPSGHQILFMEDASGIEALPVIQEFRLPGSPGANTVGAGAPLLERTRATELVNNIEIQWDPDSLTDVPARVVSAEVAESVDEVGVRTRGLPYVFDVKPWEGNANYNVAGQVSGIAQFYAERQAFARTRFNFESAWVAHGIDRGSIIRVSYPVSTTPPSFRNVTAEVESISVSPINAERVRIRARSVTKPQKGLEPVFIWTEVFTEEDDQWDGRILQEFDTWADYWSVK